MATGDMHTTWDRDREQWKNEREGAQRASGFYDRKDDASAAGRATMRREGGEWLGHRQDNNRINERNTYPRSSDPRRSEG